MRKIISLSIGVTLLLAVSGAMGQDVAIFDTKYNEVLSRLQSMGHGYYSQ